MSQALHDFFAKVTADVSLQEQLYLTKEIADVADIAKAMGFDVSGVEILRAQVGRVLQLEPEELEVAAAGKRPKTGAQWGRAGKGYLDNAGYWINEMIQWGSIQPDNKEQIELFFAKVKEDKVLQAQLLHSKTYNDVAIIAQQYHYDIIGTVLLRYMATQILMLNDERGNRLACGRS